MASLTDDNEADGNLDKRNMWLIGVGHTRTNYGYVLVDRDTNDILKFGETLYPNTRYSRSYLHNNNAVMKVLEEGSKRDIHFWQYDMNKYYYEKYKVFPPLLKSKGW